MNNRTAFALMGASVIGAVLATTVAHMTTFPGATWSGLPWMWIVGVLIALPYALVFGFPAMAAIQRFRLNAWWQFSFGGLVVALPFWYLFAQPFDSARWQLAGAYDSINILGTGLVAGFAFWALTRGDRMRSNNGLERP